MSKNNQNLKGLQLAARFALPPNSLGYCGRDSAPERFKNCIADCDCTSVEIELTKFIVLHPYLKTIGDATGSSKFSDPVVESYCIGNDILNEIKPEHYNILLDNFLVQGVPEWFVTELRDKQPKRFIPTHLFQVLHVGVGKASGSVPFNLETINNCMVRWGEIENIWPDKAQVMLNSLEIKEGKYDITQKLGVYPFNPTITPNLKVKDVVAVHWNQIIMQLSASEIKKIDFWTKEVISTVMPE